MKQKRVVRERDEMLTLTSRESHLVNQLLDILDENEGIENFADQKTIDNMAYAGTIGKEFRQEIAVAFSKYQYNEGIISKDEILTTTRETLDTTEVWNDRFCDTCRMRLTSQDLIKHDQDGKSLCIKHRNEINYRRNGNVVYGSSIR